MSEPFSSRVWKLATLAFTLVAVWVGFALSSALWRLVWILTKVKRQVADLAFRLDPNRRTL